MTSTKPQDATDVTLNGTTTTTTTNPMPSAHNSTTPNTTMSLNALMTRAWMQAAHKNKSKSPTTTTHLHHQTVGFLQQGGAPSSIQEILAASVASLEEMQGGSFEYHGGTRNDEEESDELANQPRRQ